MLHWVLRTSVRLLDRLFELTRIRLPLEGFRFHLTRITNDIVAALSLNRPLSESDPSAIVYAEQLFWHDFEDID